MDNSVQTLWTTLAGFLIATVFGLLLGIAVGWHKAIYAGLYPVLIGFNSIPKVAVVPVLILWFGIGTIPAILTAFLISFFPIVVNVATGLATTEPELEDVLRALGASKLDVMKKVGIPRSLPYFFGSLKVAITLAFVGSVVSETVGANKGIGYLMLSAQANFQVPLVFAGLLVLAVEGHRALRHHRRDRSALHRLGVPQPGAGVSATGFAGEPVLNLAYHLARAATATGDRGAALNVRPAGPHRRAPRPRSPCTGRRAGAFRRRGGRLPHRACAGRRRKAPWVCPPRCNGARRCRAARRAPESPRRAPRAPRREIAATSFSWPATGVNGAASSTRRTLQRTPGHLRA